MNAIWRERAQTCDRVPNRTSLFLEVSFYRAGRGHRVRRRLPETGALESAIGKVIAATGAVTIEHVAAVVVQASISPVGQAKVGDLVYRGDVLQTGRDGKVDLTFADGTTFNVSSNARMVLDEFVYNPNSTSNSTLFSLTKGTFNFVAGKVAQPVT